MEGYKPTEEDIKKAEDMMTGENENLAELSKGREEAIEKAEAVTGFSKEEIQEVIDSYNKSDNRDVSFRVRGHSFRIERGNKVDKFYVDDYPVTEDFGQKIYEKYKQLLIFLDSEASLTGVIKIKKTLAIEDLLRD